MKCMLAKAKSFFNLNLTFFIWIFNTRIIWAFQKYFAVSLFYPVFLAYFELKAEIDEAKKMPPQEISAEEIKVSLDGIQKQLDLMNTKIDRLDERLYELNSGE